MKNLYIIDNVTGEEFLALKDINIPAIGRVDNSVYIPAEFEQWIRDAIDDHDYSIIIKEE